MEARKTQVSLVQLVRVVVLTPCNQERCLSPGHAGLPSLRRTLVTCYLHELYTYRWPRPLILPTPIASLVPETRQFEHEATQNPDQDFTTQNPKLPDWDFTTQNPKLPDQDFTTQNPKLPDQDFGFWVQKAKKIQHWIVVKTKTETVCFLEIGCQKLKFSTVQYRKLKIVIWTFIMKVRKLFDWNFGICLQSPKSKTGSFEFRKLASKIQNSGIGIQFFDSFFSPVILVIWSRFWSKCTCTQKQKKGQKSKFAQPTNWILPKILMSKSENQDCWNIH